MQERRRKRRKVGEREREICATCEERVMGHVVPSVAAAAAVVVAASSLLSSMYK
jgi:hypothetical protein